jgi:hypothetical protein
MPKTIVSDRDPTFTSSFWREFFQLQGISLAFSSAYHPQLDGQTKALNKCLETDLHYYAGAKPKDWSFWLPLAEWWYNTSCHSSTRFTPFEVVYGYTPLTLLSYVLGTSANLAMDSQLRDRTTMLDLLKEHLQLACNRMKSQADKNRTECVFQQGDWVYLRLQPYCIVQELEAFPTLLWPVPNSATYWYICLQVGSLSRSSSSPGLPRFLLETKAGLAFFPSPYSTSCRFQWCNSAGN